MMFGYATNETEEYLPISLVLSHKLVKKLAELRHNDVLEYLGPDSKSQVVIEYKDGNVNRIDSIVISSQHSEAIELDELKHDIRYLVIEVVLMLQDGLQRILLLQV